MKRFTRVAIVMLAFLRLAFGQTEPKASIAGRILDDISETPVIEARVNVSGGSLTQPIVATTASGGEFQVSGLAPGRYRLVIEKGGYFPHNYGSGDGMVGSDLDLGSSPTDIGQVYLVRRRVISGVLRWRNGDAVPKTGVYALAVRRGKVAFRAGETMPAVTDDRGEFRLEGLRPGRYVVFAQPNAFLRADAVPRIALPVFFPGSGSVNPRVNVDLWTTPESSAVSLLLDDTSGVEVAGTVVASDGLPEGTPIHIGVKLAESPGQPFMVLSSRVGSQFRFPSVPKGSILILANARVGGADEVRGVFPLEVGSSAIEGLALTMPVSGSIRGKVEIEDLDEMGNTRISGAPRLIIFGECPELGALGSLAATSNMEGEFRLNAAVPGLNYELRFRTLPANMYVATIHQGDRKLDTLSAVRGAGDPLRIRLRKDGGQITGRVLRSQDKVARAFVLVAPKNRILEHHFRTALTRFDGTFQISALPPGEYDVYAFTHNEDDEYMNPEYLSRFSRNSKSLKIDARGSLSVDLQVADVRPR